MVCIWDGSWAFEGKVRRQQPEDREGGEDQRKQYAPKPSCGQGRSQGQESPAKPTNGCGQSRIPLRFRRRVAEGLSTRQIAKITGWNQSTIVRDANASESDANASPASDQLTTRERIAAIRQQSDLDPANAWIRMSICISEE